MVQMHGPPLAPQLKYHSVGETGCGMMALSMGAISVTGPGWLVGVQVGVGVIVMVGVWVEVDVPVGVKVLVTLPVSVGVAVSWGEAPVWARSGSRPLALASKTPPWMPRGISTSRMISMKIGRLIAFPPNLLPQPCEIRPVKPSAPMPVAGGR